MDAIAARRARGRRAPRREGAPLRRRRARARRRGRPAVRRSGIDFLAAGCHKWLFGPARHRAPLGHARGVGVRARPLIPSFANASYGAWIEGARRRRPPGAGDDARRLPGLRAPLGARRRRSPSTSAIGRERVAARIHALAGRMKAGLAEVRGVRLVTPRAADAERGPGLRRHRGRRPGPRRAGARRATGSPPRSRPTRERHLRFGCGLAVDEDDVDAAVASVARIARGG